MCAMLRNLRNVRKNTIPGSKTRKSTSHSYATNKSRKMLSADFVLDQVRKEVEEDKKDIQWQKTADERHGWKSKLGLFGDEEQNSDFIIMMQQPIDLTPKGLKKWWIKRKERIERHMQQYIPDRHRILGNDLAASHFLLYRGGAVKFLNHKDWMRADEHKEFNLPKKFDPKYKVEALRCDHMRLYYEGLENLRCLDHLKFLSFHNVTTFDDWCLDRVSGSQHVALEVLDISGTECTARGLSCLYRIPTLKLLIVDDNEKSEEFELMCLLLQEDRKDLRIVNASTVHNIEVDNIKQEKSSLLQKCFTFFNKISVR